MLIDELFGLFAHCFVRLLKILLYSYDDETKQHTHIQTDMKRLCSSSHMCMTQKCGSYTYTNDSEIP
jgi:hypothetical protein